MTADSSDRTPGSVASRLAVALRLTRMRHPHLAQVLQVNDERHLVAVELVDGQRLDDAVALGGFGLETALRMLIQTLEGLEALHQAGLVYGNVSPAAICVLANGVIKLVDVDLAFEITAKATPPVDVDVCAYAAPERVLGDAIDTRTDTYSVGAIAYELISGRRPFIGDDLASLIGKIVREEAPPPGGERSARYPELVSIIGRAMARRPDDRYASAAEMRDALADLVDRLRGQFESVSLAEPHPSVRPPIARGTAPLPDRLGAYAPLERLSDGASGDVYRARESGSDRIVVLKVLTEPVSAPPPGASSDATVSIPRDLDLLAASTFRTSGPRPRPYDDDVQFTVYRPDVIQPERWYSLLAFAHLSKRAADAGDAEPDPIEEVRRQARQVLGDTVEAFKATTQDSSRAVPRHGQLTFVPRAEGLEFNPASRQFQWTESVHREEFRARAPQELEGTTVRGALSVFLGSVLLAEVNLAIRVDRHAETSTTATSTARPYRRIFASYSHRDAGVVQEFETLVGAFGDRYLRDALTLRSGEVWSDRLRELITQADVFQLFWSRQAMNSAFVRSEWEYALGLNRPNFVRPVYWEDPFPESPGLPPEELRALHFARVMVGSAPDRVSAARPIRPPAAHVLPRPPVARMPSDFAASTPAPAPASGSPVAGRSSLVRIALVIAGVFLALATLVTIACPPR